MRELIAAHRPNRRLHKHPKFRKGWLAYVGLSVPGLGPAGSRWAQITAGNCAVGPISPAGHFRVCVWRAGPGPKRRAALLRVLWRIQAGVAVSGRLQPHSRAAALIIKAGCKGRAKQRTEPSATSSGAGTAARYATAKGRAHPRIHGRRRGSLQAIVLLSKRFKSHTYFMPHGNHQWAKQPEPQNTNSTTRKAELHV